ncbi:Flp pilus assembly protein CpaD [hydrothermal vent metagenome]|uniref:Flp pilus assembly protein CpaD n=1 Tax=hydrothermal vent metagenome TaxID=652676 RepID=A0A3B0T8R1_9ZZZZ
MYDPAHTVLLGAAPRRARKTWGPRVAPLSVAVAASLALAGCTLPPSPQTAVPQTGSLQAFQASDRHPIEVAKGKVRLEIDVPRFSPGLSPRQTAQIDAFLADYKSLGESDITVSVPSGGRNEGAAMSVLGRLRQHLRSRGIDDKAIRYTPYYVQRKTTSAPVIVSYQRYYAKPSPCGNWPDNIAEEPLNKSYEEFGCATQNNLAAMVANPRDLLVPRVMTASDATRRGITLKKWRLGEITGAERSTEESGSSSEVKE